MRWERLNVNRLSIGGAIWTDQHRTQEKGDIRYRCSNVHIWMWGEVWGLNNWEHVYMHALQGWTITKILVPFQLQYFPKIFTIMISISILYHLICNINFNFNITICEVKHQNQFQYYQRYSAISGWVSIFQNEFCNIIMTSIISNYFNNIRNYFNIAW